MDELVCILEELYIEYGAIPQVIKLSQYVDKMILEQQEKLLKENHKK